MNKMDMIKKQVEGIMETMKEEQELRDQMAKLYGDFDTQTKIHENNIINLNNEISKLMEEYWKAFAEAHK